MDGMKPSTLPAAFLTLLISLGVTQAAPAAVVFSDGTFNDSDWTLSDYNFTTTTPAGGSSTGAHQAMGGNPDDYRLMNITVNAAQGQASVNGIYSLNLRKGAVYDPATSGPIQAIGWTLDRYVFSVPSGFYVESGPLLMQNGDYFVPSLLSGNNAQWVPTGGYPTHRNNYFNLTGLHTLDFSATAPPIALGFYEFCFTQTHFPGYTAVSGIDNWSISFDTPEPGSLLVIVGAIVVCRRNRRP